jgi:hypothetical protein
MTTEEQKPIAEVHKDLLAQAEANEKANFAANAEQIAQSKKDEKLLAKNQPADEPAAKPQIQTGQAKK